MSLSCSYLPIDPYFYEVIEDLIRQGIEIKVFYFLGNLELESAKGKIDAIIHEHKSEFLKLDNGVQIRLDRLITINGKPGPLFDYYESFGNACLDCRVDF